MSVSRTLSLILAMPLAYAGFLSSASAQTVTEARTFDVASIHLNKNQADGHHHIYNDPSVSRFRTVNLALRDLIQFAYDLPKSQIMSGPEWLDSNMYDIDAKADASADAELHGLPGWESERQKRLMVRVLLADRFQLKVHQETRLLPLYELTLAKDGPRFTLSEINGTTVDSGRSRLHIAGSDDTLSLLARELALQLGHVVVNKTGLSGRYDLTLRWTRDDASAAPPTSGDAPPNLFTAIQEQLGLKLVSTKGPVPVIVIDGVEMPSPN